MIVLPLLAVALVLLALGLVTSGAGWLIASLAVNFLVIGLTVGAMWRFRGPPPLAGVTPNLLISIVNLIIILVLSSIFLDLPVKGSIFLLVFDSILFILTSLSIGLLLSINAKTQQAAMMGSLMGMMLPTLLLTGFLFPIENMPLPLQWLSNLVPSRWYFIIVKKVMLKGLGFSAVWKETLILTGMCVFLFAVSLRRFKIRLQ